jgi:hypothetical protein
MKLIMVDGMLTATVGELIIALSALDQSAPVYSQGCDCNGNVVGVRLLADGSVMIDRSDDLYL